MHDVATRAGVHRSTVGLALRDHPRIPAATRARIKAIADQLGYQTNPLVAALMRSRRMGRSPRHETIAFVTNYPTRFGWRPRHHDRPDFFPGILERANQLGYGVDHLWLAEPGMTPQRFRDILLTRSIHGLLLARMPPGVHSLALPWEHFSVVSLGMTLRNPQFHHVTENHFDTVTQAMTRCAAHGYERVGFVFSEANDSPRVGDRWLGAYLQCQSTHAGIAVLPVCPGMPTERTAFVQWLKRERPDALLVTHAAPVLKWLQSLSLKVPRDIGLVELQDAPDTGVAGVSYEPAMLGALAVDMLTGLMYRNERGVPAIPYEVMLSGTWRAGKTLPHRGRNVLIDSPRGRAPFSELVAAATAR